MPFRLAVGMLGALASCLLFASISRAQCSKDTDCKGERVCEEGSCVSPPAASPPSPAVPSAQPVASPGNAAPAQPSAQLAPAPERSVAAPPGMQRHSSGMMAGGIVMVSLVPIALLAAMVANLEQTACEGGQFISPTGAHVESGLNCGRYDATIYGGLFGSVALLGGGIPLIVIGGKKEPIGAAQLAPWATPNGAGLRLRVDL